MAKRPDSKKIAEEVMNETNCAFEKAFPDCKLIKKLDEFLEAQKVISAVVYQGKDRPTSQADGELPPANSKTNDFVDVPDYGTQIKAVDIITDIRGLRKRKLDVKHSLDQSLMAVAVQVLGKGKK